MSKINNDSKNSNNKQNTNEMVDSVHGYVSSKINHSYNSNSKHNKSSYFTNPKTQKTPYEGITETQIEMEQDIDFRDACIGAFKENEADKRQLRGKLYRFYKRYITSVTVFIFFIVIDSIAIWRNQPSYYSSSVKRMLIMAFVANIFSILAIMFHYSFNSSLGSIMKQFREIKNKKSRKHKI